MESEQLSSVAQKPMKQEEIKKEEKKKRDDTKNFLINFRSFFVDYIKMHDFTAMEDPYIQELEKKKNMNRGDYEELFKNKRYKLLISQMFEERFLQRQFQLSRSSFQVRPVYLKKIAVLKKAFELEWFPRIKWRQSELNHNSSFPELLENSSFILDLMLSL